MRPPAADDMRFLTPTYPVPVFLVKVFRVHVPVNNGHILHRGRTFLIAVQDLFGALEHIHFLCVMKAYSSLMAALGSAADCAGRRLERTA